MMVLLFLLLGFVSLANAATLPQKPYDTSVTRFSLSQCDEEVLSYRTYCGTTPGASNAMVHTWEPPPTSILTKDMTGAPGTFYCRGACITDVKEYPPGPEIGFILVAANPPTKVNDNSFTYTGSWTTSTGTGKYLNNDRYTNVTNRTYRYTFTGTKVQIYTTVDAHHGQGAVKIDTGAETTVELYSPTRQYQALIYTSPVLPSGTHTITFRVKGTKHSSSTGFYVVADRLDITP